MVEKDVLIKSKVKHLGVFDFKDMYKVLYDWLLDMGYDVNEKSYKENLGAGNLRELEIEWEAVRKVSDYFRFYLYVKWHIMGMSSVEVEIDGVKKKMNKGNFEMDVRSILEKDYEERWSKKPSINFLRTLYDRYLIKERVEEFEGKLIEEMQDFISQAKSFLALSDKK